MGEFRTIYDGVSKELGGMSLRFFLRMFAANGLRKVRKTVAAGSEGQKDGSLVG